MSSEPESLFMYRRPILCTSYGAVDFLNVLKYAVVWGGVLLVHTGSEIYYVPVDDGWDEVSVIHFVPITIPPPPPTALL